jgi:predicted MFS family arabinose efflux permease
MVITIGLLIHQIPILTEAGVSRVNAAWLASLAGAAGIAGKLIAGALLDRYRANWVGGITLAVTALAFGLLIDGIRTQELIVIAMVVNGYSAGSKLQIASYLTSRYGGIRNFGVIYGMITSLVVFGTGLGPMIAGMVYDLTGAYTAFLIAGTVGSLISGLLIMTLPRYPEWKQ